MTLRQFRAEPIGALVAALIPTAALAQVATGQGVQIPLPRIVTAFLVCVFVGFAAALILRGKKVSSKWISISTSARRIRVVETNRLNMRTSLLLVSVDGRELLLSQDSKGTTLIADLSATPKDVSVP